MLDFLLVLLSGSFLFFGLIGCVVPVIPGPILAYVGLLLLRFADNFQVGTSLLVWTGVFTLLIAVLDYIVPVWGTKKFGGSKMGVWGSTVGLIVGLFFSPVGIILGPFLGAFAFELYAGRNEKEAFLSGLGSFIGFLFGTVLKISIVVILIYFWIQAVYVGLAL